MFHAGPGRQACRHAFPIAQSSSPQPACRVITARPGRSVKVQIQCQAVATEAPAAKKGKGTSAASNGAPSKNSMSPEAASAIYRDMVLGREFEEMCAQMYYRGKMFGFVHLYSGQEAVSTGVIGALRKDDYICSTYRDHVHALSKGVPSRAIMAELFGKKTGLCRGQGGSMHMFSREHGLVSTPQRISEGSCCFCARLTGKACAHSAVWFSSCCIPVQPGQDPPLPLCTAS